MTTNSFDLERFRLRLLLAFLAGIISSMAAAEMSTLEEVILHLKEECAGYIQDGSFKGKDVSNYSLDDDYFYVAGGAVESFLISSAGRVAHLFSRHETLCADSTMNEYCGSSGCEYSLIINDYVFTLRGRFVEVHSSLPDLLSCIMLRNDPIWNGQRVIYLRPSVMEFWMQISIMNIP